MIAAAVALTAVLGLAVGSFLNVVVYRVPRGESIARPGSHCPHCATPIKARHNVPVLGWLVLRGRCAACRAPISARYPLVEAGTGALFAAVTLRLGITPQLPAFLFLAAVAVALAMIDVDLRRLPETILGPAWIGAVLLLVPAGAAEASWLPAARAGVGLLALAGLGLAAHRALPDTVTGGHVQLAGLLGLALGWLGWAPLVVGGVAGALFALATAWTSRSARFPAGTAVGACMIAGAGTALFVTVPLLACYGALVGAS